MVSPGVDTHAWSWLVRKPQIIAVDSRVRDDRIGQVATLIVAHRIQFRDFHALVALDPKGQIPAVLPGE